MSEPPVTIIPWQSALTPFGQLSLNSRYIKVVLSGSLHPYLVSIVTTSYLKTSFCTDTAVTDVGSVPKVGRYGDEKLVLNEHPFFVAQNRLKRETGKQTQFKVGTLIAGKLFCLEIWFSYRPVYNRCPS